MHKIFILKQSTFRIHCLNSTTNFFQKIDLTNIYSSQYVVLFMPLIKIIKYYIISETYHVELPPHSMRGLSSLRLNFAESHSSPVQATVVFSTDIGLCFWRIKLSMKRILRFKTSYCHSGCNLITGISFFTHTVAGCALSLFHSLTRSHYIVMLFGCSARPSTRNW